MAELGKDIGKLGFGLMRLPQKDGKTDIEQTKTMVDMFLEAGFSYFDTAWAYEGSEDAIRQALVERYPRERFQLASKNAAWINCKTRDEAIDQLRTSLERSGAGYFDYYLLHNLGETRTKVFEDFDMWSFVKEAKEKGLVKHYGFSIHGTADELDAILNDHPEAEFVQLQINYADWESPSIQSRRCYEVARKHGVPVIIMEPVKGGLLANPPEKIKKLFQEAEPGSTPSSWAIRYAADLEGAAVVLSGMSSVEQMRDNLQTMKGFSHLSESQKGVIREAVGILDSIDIIPCTSCEYCSKVCPKAIGISGSFACMNILTLYGDKSIAEHQMGWLVGGHGKLLAKDCIQCGKCEEACPQHIHIRDELSRVVEAFGQR